MASDRHRNPSVIFRPPPEDKEWLTDYAGRIGRDVSAIMTDVLADLRRKVSRSSAPRGNRSGPRTPPRSGT